MAVFHTLRRPGEDQENEITKKAKILHAELVKLGQGQAAQAAPQQQSSPGFMQWLWDSLAEYPLLPWILGGSGLGLLLGGGLNPGASILEKLILGALLGGAGGYLFNLFNSPTDAVGKAHGEAAARKLTPEERQAVNDLLDRKKQLVSALKDYEKAHVPDINPYFSPFRYSPNIFSPGSWTHGWGVPDYPYLPIGVGVGTGYAAHHVINRMPATLRHREILRQQITKSIGDLSNRLHAAEQAFVGNQTLAQSLQAQPGKRGPEYNQDLAKAEAAAQQAKHDQERLRRDLAISEAVERSNENYLRDNKQKWKDFLLGRPANIQVDPNILESRFHERNIPINRNAPEFASAVEEANAVARRMAAGAHSTALGKVRGRGLMRAAPFIIGATAAAQSNLNAESMERKRDLQQALKNVEQSLGVYMDKMKAK